MMLFVVMAMLGMAVCMVIVMIVIMVMIVVMMVVVMVFFAFLIGVGLSAVACGRLAVDLHVVVTASANSTH